MDWTLDADEEVFMVFRADPGNVDLMNTIPLPDSAANVGTGVGEQVLKQD